LKKLLVLSLLFVLLTAVSWETINKDEITAEAKKFVLKSLEKSTVSFVRIEPSELDSNAIGSLYYRLTDHDTLVGYFAYNQAAACRPGGCASYDPKSNKDAYDPFYIGVIYNAKKEIHQVKILDYYSEYGLQITRKKWLRQFEKEDGCDVDERMALDGVTGATISAKSFINQIQNNCKFLGKYGSSPSAD